MLTPWRVGWQARGGLVVSSWRCPSPSPSRPGSYLGECPAVFLASWRVPCHPDECPHQPGDVHIGLASVHISLASALRVSWLHGECVISNASASGAALHGNGWWLLAFSVIPYILKQTTRAASWAVNPSLQAIGPGFFTHP